MNYNSPLIAIFLGGLLLSGCSDDSGGRSIGMHSNAFDACIYYAKKELSLPSDTVFAWGTHRESLDEDSVAHENRDFQVVETWFVVPQNVGPPDSRTLRCVVRKDPGGYWTAIDISTEKKVSPGLSTTRWRE